MGALSSISVHNVHLVHNTRPLPSSRHFRLLALPFYLILAKLFMKPQRWVALCALLGALLISCLSASADEPRGPLGTLTSTTISGYVDTAVGEDSHPSIWWQSFLIWFGFHSR